ncbi:MAG TPA: Asp23/Gls24 family envelope stress response protein [Actinomycetes bacterium]|nr:Asp23/Gls24 family envelope stress response protein [Actinomycetes bacterium]
MTQDYDATSSPGPGGYRERGSTPMRGSAGGDPLHGGQGRTKIADAVVAKIAALAAREIPGVHSLGQGLARTLGAPLRARPAGGEQPAEARGVSVEVGESQCAVDIDLVTFYGQSIVEVAGAVRRNVVARIESMTGLEVTEVNITIDDLHVEAEGEEEQAALEPPPAP